MWIADPWQGGKLSKMHGLELEGYLDPDSISIQAIDFPRTEYMGGIKSIVVYFSDRIVGSLEKETGEFRVLGEN